MGAVVLDASAVIAFSEAGDPLHDEATRLTAEARRPGVTRLLPASAYSEVLVMPFRNGTDARVDAFLEAFDVEVTPVTAEIARVAASARATHSALRLPDALVVATALVHECDLLTLDRRMRQAHEELASG